MEFNAAELERSIQGARPGMKLFEVSAKTGQGMEQWLSFLLSLSIKTLPDPRAAVSDALDGRVAAS
jgi:hypothetical protein